MDPLIAELLEKEEAKLCPSCTTPTEKIDGCNFLQCPCGAGWCWVCKRVKHNSPVLKGETCNETSHNSH